ncbi:MBOAT family O-acyltransferase [Arenibacter sp. GZD-96]|uniref:MBOAT family O-acyltransferase n=1 Tax=Aurantibrevibacter litoralis TaxID=3106030 RepID=UPI002AFFE82F|nr:MBOAT family O-acyltransferase [Arenibacter sp. GZD-96]
MYWILLKGRLQAQNILLLLASYFFYALWDWRFLSLILASTVVDYFVGIKIHNSRNKKNIQIIWLWVSVLFNLSLLGFFKYFNFFTESLLDFFQLFGYTATSSWTLHIILPVGISFYTFQTMSYSLDIYYDRIKPTRDFLSFATFVSFFPQLVAGPIERASNLLSQLTKDKRFDYNQNTEGLKLILWGLFKKVVIADSLAPIVDDIFVNQEIYSSSTLIMGVIFFSFQVYGDFSGYSDIAIGTAKLFGIELMSNFKFPNFSRNVAEYWQRWHVSLSTWFRHYLYVPLGGSRVSKILSVRNICIIFLVSGFWHGANWTFIFWGGIHALAYIPVFLMGRNTMYKNSVIGQNSIFPSVIEIIQVLTTFALVTFSRIFFRSDSLGDSFSFINRIFTERHFENYVHPYGKDMTQYFILILVFVIYEYIIRKDERNPFNFKNRAVRATLYLVIIGALFVFYDVNVKQSFIYFQF